jgi:hypothetical protein
MSAFSNNRNIFLSYQGVFNANGLSTGLAHVSDNSAIGVSLRCDKDIVFKIFTSPSQDTTSEKTLFFKKTITANTTFHRRFACPHQYVSIDVDNTPASEGNIIMDVADFVDVQFDASTFINSNIEIDTQTALTRVANDFNTDMVRGLHNDFQKINVQGIQQYQPSAEATVGLLDQNLLSIPIAAYEFFINISGTTDRAAGTGAQQIQIDYVDSNYDAQTATVSTGTGGTFTTGITGRAVTRIQVSQVGTDKRNSGTIIIQDTTGTYTFARMETFANVSHSGVYLIPRNKHLIVTDAQLQLVGYSGLLRIYEYDYGGIGISGSIGDFRFSTAPVGQTFRLNGKISEKKMVVVNVIPDAGTPTADNNVCVNLNAVLCPAVNDF